MARIAGIDLPRNKRVEIGLTYIVGIGQTTSKMILEELMSTLVLAQTLFPRNKLGALEKSLIPLIGWREIFGARSREI